MAYRVCCHAGRGDLRAVPRAGAQQRDCGAAASHGLCRRQHQSVGPHGGERARWHQSRTLHSGERCASACALCRQLSFPSAPRGCSLHAPHTLLTPARRAHAPCGPQRAGDAPSYTDACTATQTMVGHGGTVTALARVGAYVFSCSTDCKVMLWRAASGREATLYPWFELQVGALALHRRHGTLPSSPKIQSLQATLTLSPTPHTHVLIRFSLSSPHMHKP
jgi:hypothetical protein